MAENGAAEDRTEAATPRRLQKAREQGQVPLSREIPALASLAGAALVLLMIAPGTARDAARRLSPFLSEAHQWDAARSGGAALAEAARVALSLAGPFVLAALLAGVAATTLQTGGLLNPRSLGLDLRRINPLAGLGRLLSFDSVAETGKSLVKLAAMGMALWFALSGLDPASRGETLFADAGALSSLILRLTGRVLMATLAVQTAIAVADLFWVRLRHARALRMSREEIREELKETEGDPCVKARLRQLRAQRARRRMLAAVPGATVVVTNPTHFAVALRYERSGGGAPRVVAKGVDSMAARIREVARANRVPIVENPPLARALHRVELEAEIPAEYYQAVAEVIAYVWRLGRRAAPVL